MDSLLEPAPSSGKGKKLLEQMRNVMRVKHYSLRTERSYSDWVERFIRFHRIGHPRDWESRRLAPSSRIWRIGKTSLPRPRIRL